MQRIRLEERGGLGNGWLTGDRHRREPLTTVPDEQHGAAARALYVGRLPPMQGKSLENKVQELADREEIRDLVAAYAHRMAQGPATADLFTDDGAYINRGVGDMPPKEVRGRAALDKHYADRSDWPERPLPMIHNQLISVEGDEARGICSMELRMASNGESWIGAGYYEDRYRRENGQWKFAERIFTYFHWVPLHLGWAKQPAS